MPCAIVILTKNEEKNLPRCLDAVPPGAEVIVIDSGSVDSTLDIARSRGCVVLENDWAGFAAQRNYAIRKLRNQYSWLLFIDADEIYPAHFFTWLNEFIENSGDIEVAEVPSRIVLDGKVLNFAPGYPIYHPRLVRTSREIFIESASGHGETVMADAKMVRCGVPYDHYSIDKDITTWLAKHINLAKMEALSRPHVGKATFRSRISGIFSTGLGRVPLRFAYHYVVRFGFLDGRAGLKYSIMYSWFELTKYLIKAEI